ncbi:MAG: hypothetical protein WBC18_27770 [Ottowia sp.]|uniref:hypothetical protein n=1 Tax=Ottowia sp. TaxID=1898956 RepID=UPI003C707624
MNRAVFTGPLRRLVRVCAAAACLTLGTTAVAAPYWTGYRGTIQNSNIPDITNGLQYTVNFIFDNGGTSAASQTWGKAHLKCVVWRFNVNSENSEDVRFFVQDLTKPGANWNATGQIQTNGAGGMTSMYTQVGTYNLPGTTGAGAGRFTDLSPTPVEPYWGIPETAVDGAVFIAGAVAGTYTDIFEDASGGTTGISTAVNRWRPVEAFPGWGYGPAMPGCAGPNDPRPPVNTVASVPALELPGLALLGLAAAGLGACRLRQRRKSR